MHRLTAIVLFMFMTVNSVGQNIPGHEDIPLLKALNESKTDVDRIDILFSLAQHHLLKQGEEEADLKSATGYIQRAAHLNAAVKSTDAYGYQILLESVIARKRHHRKEAKQMAERAVGILVNGTNKFYLGNAYSTLAEYYDYSNPNENTEKVRLTELAVQAFLQSSNVERQAYTLTFLADLYNVNGERPKALEKLNTALQLYKSINYPKLQAVYILYCNLYFTDGNYKQALNYGLMALKSALDTQDSTLTLCQINNYIATILVRLNERERATSYFKDALQIAMMHNDNNAVLQLMANMVNNYVELKRPDEALAFMRTLPHGLLVPRSEESYIYAPLAYFIIYKELKKYREAQLYSNEILQLIKVHKPADKILHHFYLVLIGFYLQSGQYTAAGMYIGKIDSLSNKMADPALVKENYFVKFRLDTAQGRYQRAVGNLLEYHRLNDSLFNETTSKQLKQLEVEYETERTRNELKIKDQDILVLKQRNQLQQNSLDQARVEKNLVITGIGLLFVILGLLYWQYRNKQQSNKIIVDKNVQLQHLLTEKEWLVKEIHHRVKNNFHVVASLLEIQSSYLKNQEALSAIKDSQHRIHSMSIIHQKLYQSETLSTIHMPEYIYELVEYLRDSYAIRDDVRFDLQIENIELNHAIAITLGLILNEAITNSIKYAFKDTDGGRISISLSQVSNARILLRIADNGCGLPGDFNNQLGTSMGMELLQGLTEDINGNFSIENRQGTTINILFKHNAPAPDKLL